MFDFVLDLRTLMFLATAIGAIYSIGIFFFGKNQRDYMGFELISGGIGALVLGFLFLIAQSYFSDTWLILVSNVLLAIGTVCFYLGLKLFCLEEKGLGPFLWGVVSVGFVGFLYFLYIHPSFDGRLVMVQSGHFLMNLTMVRLLLSDLSVSWRTPRIVTACVIALDGIYAIFAVLWVLIESPELNFLEPANVLGFFFLNMILLVTGVAFGLIWMVSMRYKERLLMMAMHDPLTNVLNRRGIEVMLEQEAAKVERERMMMSAMILDIDHFKNINDSYGHSVGDWVLAGLANEVQKFLRKYDIFGRIGGEEFIILLPDTTLDQAVMIAERLRVHVEGFVFAMDELRIMITVSVGVSDHFPQNAKLDSLIPFADRALFQAKQAGRNQVAAFREKNVAELI